ncbi:Phage repressor [hydrothermal vent metagenome]|uniref:Phage repressor n=1 Tax=hydrothermal vent metagenome TaxID=652676 RepID=A0A3B0UK40_9ZZZZ
MLTHQAIWDAIDALANRHQLSTSGLARLAGLDPTAFNPSKRVGKDGRKRWPSTESISKILDVTNENFDSFLAGGGGFEQKWNTARTPSVPLVGLAQAGSGGFFDAGGFPVGQGWDQVPFPASGYEVGTYALEVSGDSMLPAYRDGDILIVSPSEQLRRGDRVVVRTIEGEVTAKILYRKTTTSIELHSLNPEHAPRTLKHSEVDWIARILWASQ